MNYALKGSKSFALYHHMCQMLPKAEQSDIAIRSALSAVHQHGRRKISMMSLRVSLHARGLYHTPGVCFTCNLPRPLWHMNANQDSWICVSLVMCWVEQTSASVHCRGISINCFTVACAQQIHVSSCCVSYSKSSASLTELMYSTCIVHMYCMHMFVHTIVHIFCGYLRSLFRIFITDCQATIVLLLLYYYYYFRTIKDGEETVITLENGKMVSKRINGVEQLAIK